MRRAAATRATELTVRVDAQLAFFEGVLLALGVEATVAATGATGATGEEHVTAISLTKTLH